ncbi:MAG TPA: hypothetical protein VGY96_24520 [Streptosporangiaceae bacterium]|nr:hypothetical protein [Streptosporangiaceae bacterium]
MKIDTPSVSPSAHPLAAAIPSGIYPYLGGSVDAGLLRSVVTACGGAVVSGRQGAKLAAKTPGVLIDPAAYGSQAAADSGPLFDYDEWLMRQQAAGVPLVLTDTPRIRNDDRSALRKALARWAAIDDPTLVVLPIEPWWLREGLACLTEEVRAAGRPVAIVLLHRYNGLDAAGAVAGLLRFISDVGPLPVVLLRCDLSAVGAVAHGAFGGFVGSSANTRHGPLPMRRPDRADGDDERDDSPSVFVPALHSYVKTSNLPALARHRPLNALRCGDPVCRGDSLLRISDLGERDLLAGRILAGQHNMACTEQIACRILSAADPRDAWSEACRAGADMNLSLTESGISLPTSRWLRQWLDLRSASRERQAVR